MTFPSLDLIEGPHRGIEVQVLGAPASAALVMLHGRDASAKEILGFGRHLRAGSWTLVAPSAAGGSWFPASFQAPLADNEPALSSALAAVRAILLDLREAGYTRLAVMGFSQGACLTLETVARMGEAGGGTGDRGPVDGRGGRPLVEAAFGLSGALFGPLGLEHTYELLDSRPRVYLSVHEGDSYIPHANVRASADILSGLGAVTSFTLHPGSSHIIRPADIAAIQAFLDS